MADIQDENGAVDLDALRDELFALYDAMNAAHTAYRTAESRAEAGRGSYADANEAHRAYLDATTALHDRINRIGRRTPPGTASGGER